MVDRRDSNNAFAPGFLLRGKSEQPVQDNLKAYFSAPADGSIGYDEAAESGFAMGYVSTIRGRPTGLWETRQKPRDEDLLNAPITGNVILDTRFKDAIGLYTNMIRGKGNDVIDGVMRDEAKENRNFVETVAQTFASGSGGNEQYEALARKVLEKGGLDQRPNLVEGMSAFLAQCDRSGGIETTVSKAGLTTNQLAELGHIRQVGEPGDYTQRCAFGRVIGEASAALAMQPAPPKSGKTIVDEIIHDDAIRARNAEFFETVAQTFTTGSHSKRPDLIEKQCEDDARKVLEKVGLGQRPDLIEGMAEFIGKSMDSSEGLQKTLSRVGLGGPEHRDQILALGQAVIDAAISAPAVHPEPLQPAPFMPVMTAPVPI